MIPLSLIQSTVAGLLRAHAPFAAQGVAVVEDDGSYPKIPARESALSYVDGDTAKKGLCLTVWRIESGGLSDGSFSGGMIHEIELLVVIDESATLNRSAQGTGITAEGALEETFRCLIGKEAQTAMSVVMPQETPFENYGVVNGVRRIAALFTIQHSIIT